MKCANDQWLTYSTSVCLFTACMAEVGEEYLVHCCLMMLAPYKSDNLVFSATIQHDKEQVVVLALSV